MYCIYCGSEIADEAVICPHCGRVVNEKKLTKTVNPTNNEETTAINQPSSEGGLVITAKVFMILGCVLNVISIMNNLTAYEIESGTAFLIALISLAWTIPMTVIYFRNIKNHQKTGTGFKICTLLFVSLVSGILMLCDKKN